MTTSSPLGTSKIATFIATRDRAKAKAFYQDTLGLSFVSEDQFATVFDIGGIRLRVTPVKEIALAPYTVLGWDVADIAKTVAALSKAGVKFEQYGLPGQEPSGIWTAPGSSAKVAWFKDPDGNLLSLAQH